MTLDGSWIDIASIVLALLASAIRPVRHKIRHGQFVVTYRDGVTDVLSGASILPFLLMIGAVFSSDVLKQALNTNKLYMAIGGIIGLFAVVAELSKYHPPAHCRPGAAQNQDNDTP